MIADYQWIGPRRNIRGNLFNFLAALGWWLIGDAFFSNKKVARVGSPCYLCVLRNFDRDQDDRRILVSVMFGLVWTVLLDP